MSKQHAVLTIIKGGKHYISDLKSTNGTKCDKVNLRPYSLYEVYHNVVIEFGDLKAKYEIVCKYLMKVIFLPFYVID